MQRQALAKAAGPEAIPLDRIPSARDHAAMPPAKPKPEPSTEDHATDERLVRAFQYAAETRRFEIERYWQRSLFFWGFIAAALVGYATLSDTKYDPHLRQVITAFAIVASLAWTLQNRGSKYWQEAWEAKVERLELQVLGLRLFGDQEPRKKTGLWGGWRYSASRVTTQLSDFTLATWLLLAWEAFSIRLGAPPDAKALVIAAVAVSFCGVLLIGGRSSTPAPADGASQG